ncbi:DegT/DnrJ/EryC1/StrS aminotransferase family protein [Candidatus Woesearchaeota archaeon]|nr:DegT/DnrJ/EryC1/StrS aminotransferase family protein [Candidatus Woesearchaeota archaeon]
MKSSFYNEAEIKNKLCNFILNSRRFSMWKLCSKFERSFSDYQNRKYSVLFNSGSSANLALIQALLNLKILKKGDNVGFSALTWATNPMPLMQLGLNPIPIDVSLDNLNITSKNLIDILEKTDIKALFLTNLLGFAGDINNIADICREKNILLLEDNCESLGSQIKLKKLGNFGMAGSFSFFVGHHMSTIEGGMVCTDDRNLYDMLVMVRAHGWARNLSPERRKELIEMNQIPEFYNLYTFYTLGYNLRPTEITGFLGVEALKHIDEINRKRQDNFKKFKKAAEKNKNKDFQKLILHHMDFISNFAYPLVCNNKESFERYKKKFLQKRIEIRPIVGGSIVEQPFFKQYLKERQKKYSCPNAKKIHEFGFYFPNNPELTDVEINIICKILEEGCKDEN